MLQEYPIPKESFGKFISQRLIWWILFLIILSAAFIRLRLIEAPLERDEGEYAYAGQLILQGLLPYQNLYNMKLPGIYAAYALILTLFGQTHGGIHLGLIAINAITILFLFLLAKRLADALAGEIAAASFAVLSMEQAVQGIFANAEHFVILFAVIGLFLLIWGDDKENHWLIFGSGLMLGTGFLMKQHGAAFIALAGFYTLLSREYKKTLILAISAGIPYAITCLLFTNAGIFDKFWFWTVAYAKAYSTQVPLQDAWVLFQERAMDIFNASPLLWVLAGIGLTSLLWDRQIRIRSLFILLFLLFSFLAIFPGFYFRPHYFILTLPVIGLLGGIGVSSVANGFRNNRQDRLGIMGWGVVVIAVISIGLSLWNQRLFLFQMTPFQASRSTYGLNPFPESLEVARFIRANTHEKDRIAIIGSEPQIYFYSGRRAATGYIYMYPMMEYHDFALQMQKEMIKEIETARPKILVFTNISTSWLMRENSHRFLLEWLESYGKKYYHTVGIVEIRKDQTLYHWAPDIKELPSPSHIVEIWKRR